MPHCGSLVTAQNKRVTELGGACLLRGRAGDGEEVIRVADT